MIQSTAGRLSASVEEQWSASRLKGNLNPLN